jgi:hypothetical protein
MNKEWRINGLRIIILILFQVFILKGIRLSDAPTQYVNIIIYPVAILLLPMDIPQFFVLLIAFTAGLTVDLFYNSIGVHAAACLWMAACRTFVLKFLEPKSGYSIDQKPNGYSLGIFWFFQYVSALMLIYFFFYFSLEIFTFVYLGEILIKTILSFVVSMFVISILQILLNPKN